MGFIPSVRTDLVEKREQVKDLLSFFWRRHPESDRGIKVLQTSALPLGYGAVFGTGILYHVGAGLSMLFAKIFFYFCEGREGGFTVVEQRQKEKPEAITSK